MILFEIGLGRVKMRWFILTRPFFIFIEKHIEGVAAGCRFGILFMSTGLEND